MSTGRAPQFSLGKAKGGYRPGQMQQFTPEQLQLFGDMFSHLGPNSFLSKLASGDQSQFEALEKPALRQFGELQGGLASRFSGMGARRSSGFQNTLNQASSDFAQQLQSQRLGLQRNAIQDLMGLSNQLLQQRPYENFLVKQDPSGWQQFLSGLVGGAAKGLGAFGTTFGANRLFNNQQQNPRV
jgi:hypothetical protein